MNAQEDLKTRLMKGFEAIIERMLANTPAPGAITLQYAETTAGDAIPALPGRRVSDWFWLR